MSRDAKASRLLPSLGGRLVIDYLAYGKCLMYHSQSVLLVVGDVVYGKWALEVAT